MKQAYAELVGALTALREAGRDPVRDSDVKRKILEKNRDFDEAVLGFSKFSLFLAQASDDGVVELERSEAGNLDVSLPRGEEAHVASDEGDDVDTEAAEARSDKSESRTSRSRKPGASTDSVAEATGPKDAAETEEADHADDEAAKSESRSSSEEAVPSEPVVVDVLPSSDDEGRRLGPRRGSTRRRGGDEPPPFFAGQTVGATADASSSAKDAPAATSSDSVATSDDDSADTSEAVNEAESASAASGEETAIDSLGLPSDPGAIVRYMTHRYKGVGEKTAETLVDRLGTDIFNAFHERPETIASIVPAGRAEQVLEAWRSDYERRTGSQGESDSGATSSAPRRSSGRGRGRGRSSD